MEIIGAGFGRTGTTSLKGALEQLGFKPCYHFLEIFTRPGHIKTWQAASDGGEIDWQNFLSGYKAGLDYPMVGFYKELLEAFPNAKVILTMREPEKWDDSTEETIFQGTVIPDWLLKLLPPFRGLKSMVNATTWDRLFHGKFEDRAYAIRIFEEHIQEVQRVVPTDRLLIFQVKDEWKPLCAFWGVPEPKINFLYINERKMTKRMYTLARVIAPLVAFFGISLLFWLFYIIL